MNKANFLFLYAIAISLVPAALYPNDASSQGSFGIMTLLQSPLFFAQGCKELAESIDSLSSSLEKLPVITHTWDPESRQLSNAVVKEFAITATWPWGQLSWSVTHVSKHKTYVFYG